MLSRRRLHGEVVVRAVSSRTVLHDGSHPIPDSNSFSMMLATITTRITEQKANRFEWMITITISFSTRSVFLRVKTDNSRGLEIRDTCLLEIDRFFTHPPRSAPPRSLRERGQPFFYKPACRLYSNYISFVRALVFRRIHWGPPPWIIKIDLCGD